MFFRPFFCLSFLRDSPAAASKRRRTQRPSKKHRTEKKKRKRERCVAKTKIRSSVPTSARLYGVSRSARETSPPYVYLPVGTPARGSRRTMAPAKNPCFDRAGTRRSLFSLLARPNRERNARGRRLVVSGTPFRLPWGEKSVNKDTHAVFSRDHLQDDAPYTDRTFFFQKQKTGRPNKEKGNRESTGSCVREAGTVSLSGRHTH